MKKEYRDILNSLIETLNKKTDEELYNEIISAGVIVDDISNNNELVENNPIIEISGYNNYCYRIKKPNLLCA